MGLLKEFSIQLYSIREETEKDFSGAVHKIAALGYTGVEFAGYGNLTAVEMKKLLADCGLKSIGSHIGSDALANKLDEIIEYNHAIGSQYIVCPHHSFDSKDSILAFAEKCNTYAEKIAKAGMKFGYHNHDHEFKKFDDEYGLDIFYANTDKNLVVAELDLFWLAHAGVEILPYLDKYGERVELLHLKQIKDLETKRCVNLKDGIIDFKSIVEKGLANNCQSFILEQEEFDEPMYDALKKNFDYIMGM